MRFLEMVERGATVASAAAAAGYDAEMAELMADHYGRLGVLELPRDSGCASACPSVNPDAPRKAVCAGCFFAR